MIIAETIAQTRNIVAGARKSGRTIGLVPTMGALHEGHFSLIKRCIEQCDFTVVSIFVNPTQFGAGEDLNNYPRSFEADGDACRELGVDLIFAPKAEEMYPGHNLTWISVEKLTEQLCGSSRPHHFRGVCTVVAKLFNIIMPDRAYFGQKDAQQLAVIERMAAELNMSVEICPCPIVREADGLALSSRNRYLNARQRQAGLCLWRALMRAKELIATGERDSAAIIGAMRGIINKESETKIDYISIVDNELLQPLGTIDREALIALAVHVGPARLIDNIIVDPTGKI